MEVRGCPVRAHHQLRHGPLTGGNLPASALVRRLVACTFMVSAWLLTGSQLRGADAVRRTEDIVYGRKDGMALTLDLFQPERPNGAALMFLVNGGWLSSKETPLMVTIRPADYEPFLRRGFTVFAVVTSSQPRFVVADEMADVQRAARFIRHNARRFSIDPQRLGVMGSSSGGHLTLSLATQGGPGKPDDRDPIEREDSRVQAAACFFPPTDFLNYGAPGANGLGAGPLAPLEVAFGVRGLDANQRQLLGRTLSPIYHITKALPPTVIIHGDADDVVPLEQSQRFADRARELGGAEVRLIVRPGKGHGWGDFWRSSEDIDEFVRWFEQHLATSSK